MSDFEWNVTPGYSGGDEDDGQGGVREPRRPLNPPLSGGAALPLPEKEMAWAL